MIMVKNHKYVSLLLSGILEYLCNQYMRLLHYIGIPIFLLLLVLACNNEDDNMQPISAGYEYFPIEEGYFRDYRVNSKTYFIRPDSILGETVLDSTVSTIYLREMNAERILDPERDSIRKVKFFIKRKFEDDWPTQADSVALVKIKNDELIYTLNNKTFVKLIFPVKEKLSWNGNKFNSLGKEDYFISQIAPLQLDSVNLNNVITVVHSDNINLLGVDQRTEEYAPDIGLAQKNTRILQYIQENGEVLTGEIASGKIVLQELIDYGKI
jgi:hypothetical protein